jgi:hypothetical protein
MNAIWHALALLHAEHTPSRTALNFYSQCGAQKQVIRSHSLLFNAMYIDMSVSSMEI